MAGQPNLVEMVSQLMVEGKLLDALDGRLRGRGGFNEEEVERVLHLGMLCAFPDTSKRPAMRQVVKLLEGKTEAFECENEGMEAYLLQKSKDICSNDSQSFSGSIHPTFQDIRQSLPSSMSISWSDTTMEGR